MQEHKEGVPSQFRAPYKLSGTVRCHRVGSSAGGGAAASTRAEASSPAELQSGCSPVSPRLQGVLGASPWGWGGGPLSQGGVLLLRTCVTSGGVTEEVNRLCNVRGD